MLQFICISPFLFLHDAELCVNGTGLSTFVLFKYMVFDEFRMKENSKGREESSQTGNLHVDLGCASRYYASRETGNLQVCKWLPLV